MQFWLVKCVHVRLPLDDIFALRFHKPYRIECFIVLTRFCCEHFCFIQNSFVIRSLLTINRNSKHTQREIKLQANIKFQWWHEPSSRIWCCDVDNIFDYSYISYSIKLWCNIVRQKHSVQLDSMQYVRRTIFSINWWNDYIFSTEIEYNIGKFSGSRIAWLIN